MKYMQSSSNNAIEHLLRERVLSLFALPDGDVIWRGDSELNTQSFVYYFCINDNNFLLVNEPYHGVSDGTLVNSLTGNAIAPHQRVTPILPREGTCTYVTVSGENDTLVPQLAGDFSLFRILDR